jgi:hypothetical protein
VIGTSRRGAPPRIDEASYDRRLSEPLAPRPRNAACIPTNSRMGAASRPDWPSEPLAWRNIPSTGGVRTPAPTSPRVRRLRKPEVITSATTDSRHRSMASATLAVKIAARHAPGGPSAAETLRGELLWNQPYLACSVVRQAATCTLDRDARRNHRYRDGRGTTSSSGAHDLPPSAVRGALLRFRCYPCHLKGLDISRRHGLYSTEPLAPSHSIKSARGQCQMQRDALLRTCGLHRTMSDRDNVAPVGA